MLKSKVTSKYGLQAKSMKRWTLMNFPSHARVTSTKLSLSSRESRTETIVEWWLFHFRLYSVEFPPKAPAILSKTSVKTRHKSLVLHLFVKLAAKSYAKKNGGQTPATVNIVTMLLTFPC